ncbi:SURF1 family protein [Rhodoligotrophos defluvii]|uniref:SURF1 family protein n=1 Tax=Rhodoligotrophos defluvii TaxID=2561934 RepID=UPI0010C9B736|nr:SURF1 family protein [Rhodoligotrophos defluvii]
MSVSDRWRLRKLWPVTVASIVCFAVLMALGFWQLQRREWKHDLIARIDAALAAEPVELTSIIGSGHPWPQDFTKVRATGSFGRAERHLFTTFDGAPGWRVISPFMLANGQAVLVDRGFAPQSVKNTVQHLPEGEVTITGVVRLHDEGKGLFTPENRPAQDQWYWWDLPALAKSLADTTAGYDMLPLVIQFLPGQRKQGWPMAIPARPDLSDRHLGYAITWFGLAACLLAVYAAFVRSVLRAGSPP